MLPHPQPDISSENATKQYLDYGEMDIVYALPQDLQVTAPSISKLSQIN